MRHGNKQGSHDKDDDDDDDDDDDEDDDLMARSLSMVCMRLLHSSLVVLSYLYESFSSFSLIWSRRLSNLRRFGESLLCCGQRSDRKRTYVESTPK